MPDTKILSLIQSAQQCFHAEAFSEAIQLCKEVLQQDSRCPEALELLAISYCQTEQFESAIAAYQEFLKVRSTASAHYNLGSVFAKLNRSSEAIEQYQKAIELDSNSYQVHYNLGNTYQALGQIESAIEAYRQALKINSDHRSSLHNLGLCLKDSGQFEEAIEVLKRALVLKPDHALTHNSLGDIFRELGQYDQAIEHLKRAIKLDAEFAEAYNNLGLTYYYQSQFQAAISCYQKVLQLRPDHIKARYNYSFLLLSLGHLSQGFQEYETRWQVGQLKRPEFDQPEWDGSDLTGKRILLLPEQGLGDTIQFIRYAQLVKQKGATVLFCCPKPLVKLFSNITGIDQLIPEGSPLPEFDCYAFLLSLPRLLGTTIETIPTSIPYLQIAPTTLIPNQFVNSADAPPPKSHATCFKSGNPPNAVSPILGDFENPKYFGLKSTRGGFRGLERSVAIKDQLDISSSKFKVGIVWAGNPKNENDRYRSMQLSDFSPLFDLPNIEFYSLQKDKPEEIKKKSEKLQDLDSQLKDFVDTAAIIQQLDLVITVDTSVAHLAGALGKPVWILLCAIPDWRWMLDRDDSLWYPTAKLFRQHQLGNWETVITQVKQALQQITTPQTTHSSNLTKQGIGIGFPIGGNIGWGVYGLNLALQLLKYPKLQSVPLMPVSLQEMNAIAQFKLTSLSHYSTQIQQLLKQHPDKILNTDLVVLKGLGNQFATTEENQRIFGKFNIGVIFSEETHFTPQALEQAKRYDRIIAGSTWNAEILKGYGLTNVEMVPQGIDPTLFHPAPKSGILSDRFVIFSGGKLEYRKGQDLVVAAFRMFQARYPEALLLTAWHNHWAQTMLSLEQSKYIQGIPTINASGKLEITDWVVKNGIPSNAILDVGMVTHAMKAQIIREADVAIFPNRAEGGTNLVAMECFACGIPTILSQNTGHLDLIDPAHCYPLISQKPVANYQQHQGTDGWGESDLDEMVEMLEQIYLDRVDAQHRGTIAAEFMQQWTWEKQIGKFLHKLQEFL